MDKPIPGDYLVYLASPYSDDDPEIRHTRYTRVCRAAAKLMSEGFHIFSPIAHTHSIACAGRLPMGWEYWRKYDEIMLRASKSMFILTLRGWDKSAGIKGEIELFKGSGPIWLVNEELDQWTMAGLNRLLAILQ